MALTDAQIRALRPTDTPYKKGVGGGLYIEVFPNGSKLWRWKFRVAGKEKRLALGAYPTVGLADARKRRDAERKKLEFGSDPAVDRKRAKAAAKISAANTFAAVANEYIDSKMVGEGRAEATVSKARWFLEQLEPARRQDEGAARSRRTVVPAGERNADRTSRAYRRGQICGPVRLFASRPMSENTLNASFRRMGFGKDEVTAHGLRATASTMLNESGHWNPDAIERALADGESNATRGAYHRGLYGDERVKMGQWWSD